MNLRAALPLLSLALLTACGPKDISRDEVKSVVFPDKGVVGGYDFGVAWDEVKANPNEIFEVRDDDFKQLRRKLGDNAGSNGYFIGFHLDDAGKVQAFDVSINGQKQNAVTVRQLLDDVIAHFDKTVGNGTCGPIAGEGNSSTCDWSTPGKPSVHLMYMEFDDPISGTIDIDVGPPPSE